LHQSHRLEVPIPTPTPWSMYPCRPHPTRPTSGLRPLCPPRCYYPNKNRSTRPHLCVLLILRNLAIVLRSTHIDDLLGPSFGVAGIQRVRCPCGADVCAVSWDIHLSHVCPGSTVMSCDFRCA
jgi:hypothetical protein